MTTFTWGDTPEVSPAGVEAQWCPGPAIHLPPPFHPYANLMRSYFGSARAARAVDDSGFDVALVLACQWAQAPEALRRLRTPHLYFAQEGRRRSLEAGYLSPAARAGWQRAPWSVGRWWYDAVGGRLDRLAITSAEAVAANSEFTACKAGRGLRHLGRGHRAWCRCPADSVRVAADPNLPIALLVGALDPSKGGELAVRSLARVPKAHRPALHLIANRGEQAYGTMLAQLGTSLGVTVQLLQGIADDELISEYQHAELLLALAPNEPFGLTVLEASACGTPTVALGQGGYRRTVDPAVNGILVGDNPDDIAARGNRNTQPYAPF